MSMKLERPEVNDFEKQNLGVKEIYRRASLCKMVPQNSCYSLYRPFHNLYRNTETKKRGVGNVISKISKFYAEIIPLVFFFKWFHLHFSSR